MKTSYSKGFSYYDAKQFSDGISAIKISSGIDDQDSVDISSDHNIKF